MTDYKKMYQLLFQATTNAINILQKAQIETEDIYINTVETENNEKG